MLQNCLWAWYLCLSADKRFRRKKCFYCNHRKNTLANFYKIIRIFFRVIKNYRIFFLYVCENFQRIISSIFITKKYYKYYSTEIFTCFLNGNANFERGLVCMLQMIWYVDFLIRNTHILFYFILLMEIRQLKRKI